MSGLRGEVEAVFRRALEKSSVPREEKTERDLSERSMLQGWRWVCGLMRLVMMERERTERPERTGMVN